MKFTILAFLLLSSISAFSSTKTKIATCAFAASGGDPAGTIVVYFSGGDIAKPENYTVAYSQADVHLNVHPIVANLAADKSKLELVFMKFMTLSMKDGVSNDSLLGVMLGAPPQNISCQANLNLI